jgi:hypothetical protein
VPNEFPKWLRGAPSIYGMVEVCLRWLKFAQRGLAVANVYPRCLRVCLRSVLYSLGVSEVCLKWA